MTKLNTPLIYTTSFLSGFLCLAIEIIWIRLISFTGMSAPHSFSYTLGMFLIGIALGALMGREICRTGKVNLTSIGKIYLLAGIVDVVLLSIAIILAQNEYAQYIFGMFVLISAAIRGMVFPIIHHIGASKNKSGREISSIYFLNVLGSSLAPILISFVVLDLINTQQAYLSICIITLLLAGFCLMGTRLALIAFITCLFVTPTLMLKDVIIERISTNSYTNNYPAMEILENKHGFIQLYKNKDTQLKNDVLVFGNNAYDGRVNTNIFTDTNGIARSYLLTTMNTDLRNVLVVGMSTGAWTEVLRRNPNIDKITVVEINPQYVELIKKHPVLSGILKDKRIEIVFDDGRKWIKKNQDKKFDLVMINTTFHWRAYSSNLLSAEFLGLLKNVVSLDGLAYYNSTMSGDAFLTAKSVFENVYKHKYMIAVSHKPLMLNEAEILGNMCNLQLNGNALFKDHNECQAATDLTLKEPLVPYEKIDFSFSFHSPEIITDDNMITEYKHGGNKTIKD